METRCKAANLLSFRQGEMETHCNAVKANWVLTTERLLLKVGYIIRLLIEIHAAVSKVSLKQTFKDITGFRSFLLLFWVGGGGGSFSALLFTLAVAFFPLVSSPWHNMLVFSHSQSACGRVWKVDWTFRPAACGPDFQPPAFRAPVGVLPGTCSSQWK